MKSSSTDIHGYRGYSFGPEVWKIAFSAFFADLGYQAVIAGLPLFLVLTLNGPTWVFGVATALAYGPGAIAGYIGGRLGDRFGRKRIAVLGNGLIPLLSLTGVAASAAMAIGLFVTGWWARNFRTPARRAMLTEVVSQEQEPRAFGLLHALDIGGGLLAAVAALLLVLFGVPFRTIFLLTLVPLIISTFFVALVRAGRSPADDQNRTVEREQAAVGSQRRSERTTTDGEAGNLRLYRGVLIASALFGFSFYSLGFPILTAAQSAGGAAPHAEAAGVLAYVLYLGVSAPTGLIVGVARGVGARTLALWGYFAACVGSVVLAVVGAFGSGPVGLYAGVVVLGLALGVVETLEPTIVSRVTSRARKGRGMGALTAARSAGLFAGNLIMGLLYHFGSMYSYGYAALVALAAAVILLGAASGRTMRARR